MNARLKEFFGKHIMLPIFGLERSVKIYFYLKTKQKINVKSPTGFCEKIQVRKLNSKSIYSELADKYKVREYVKEKIGEEYLIPLYFAKEKITVEDLEKLPNSFVLKTNNGCKTNIIVKDKTKEDLNKIVKQMNKYTKRRFGYNSFEVFYNDIKPLIIAEEYIGDENSVPIDYKFHTFNQKNGKFIIKIQADQGRFSGHHNREYFNESWQLEPYYNSERLKDYKFEKPKNLKKMLEVAKKLASDFDYVRVDLYSVGNKVYFGELTFTHGSGYEVLSPKKYDQEWGSYWK